DGAMSLEPQWYSSIYGAILSASGVVAGTALAIVSIVRTSTSDELRVPTFGEQRELVYLSGVLNDMGNLLLSFIMLATYFSFSQFLIIWSGNLPAEISWYVRRMSLGWGDLGLAVAASFFVIPFLMLLSREGKRSGSYLATVAVIVLIAYAAYLFWNIVPAFESLDASGIALFACGLVTIAGFWAALYFFHLGRILRRYAPFADRI